MAVFVNCGFIFLSLRKIWKSMENSIVFIYQKTVDLVAVLPERGSPHNFLMAVCYLLGQDEISANMANKTE